MAELLLDATRPEAYVPPDLDDDQAAVVRHRQGGLRVLAFARREIEALAAEAKWSAGECAPARDLHVFLTETVDDVPAAVKRVANRRAKLHLERARAAHLERERIARAERFNQGFDTVEALSSAIVDMRLHLAGDAPIDPTTFEAETLAAIGMPREIVMRHRTPQFLHVFSSDGYAAAYYSYLWADSITADAWEAFTEAGGPWDREVADRLIRHVFAAGNTVDPAEGYRAFRGRDPQVGALMRKRGFPERGA